jgi:hypothetical protein
MTSRATEYGSRLVFGQIILDITHRLAVYPFGSVPTVPGELGKCLVALGGGEEQNGDNNYPCMIAAHCVPLCEIQPDK